RDLIIRVDAQRGFEMGFRSIQISFSQKDDTQAPLGLIIVRVEPHDILKGLLGFGYFVLTQINKPQFVIGLVEIGVSLDRTLKVTKSTLYVTEIKFCSTGFR